MNMTCPCGAQMVPRPTALIMDCLICGHSITLEQIHQGVHKVDRSSDVIHQPGSPFFKYFDGQEKAWRYARYKGELQPWQGLVTL